MAQNKARNFSPHNNKNQQKNIMSATEKNQQTCLSPEAYIRIIRNCNNTEPKFRSSVYPKQQPKKPKK